MRGGGRAEPSRPRIALVSGGTRGIGLAVAQELGGAGDRVVVTTRSSAAPPGLHGVPCDVRAADQVDEAVDRVEREHGWIEVLVANAGATDDRLLLATTDEQFADVLETNLLGAVRLVRRTLRGMLRRRHGRIVLVSSVSALSGAPGQTGYAAAKAGLIGFARSLVHEVGPRDITVNVVLPGWIDTDMTRAAPEAVRSAALAATPQARSGSPQDVARVVQFLCRRDTGFVTGAVIPIDGGAGMGH